MIRIELPETQYMLATRHLIPDGEKELHTVLRCSCNPDCVKEQDCVVITHKVRSPKK